LANVIPEDIHELHSELDHVLDTFRHEPTACIRSLTPVTRSYRYFLYFPLRIKIKVRLNNPIFRKPRPKFR
jgi:hypothetical protein